MEVVSLESRLALAPPEVLDIVTEKVRKECPKSFQALESTSRAFRDSARRCTRSLVVNASNEDETRTGLEPEKESCSTSARPCARLLEEIKKRPRLSNILLMEPSSFEWPPRSSILAALCSTPWVNCKAIGAKKTLQVPNDLTGEYALAPWEGSYAERALSNSQASLRELNLTSFDFGVTNSELAETIQGFPFLTSLKLGGYGLIGGALTHDNLVNLDISELMTGPPAMEMVHLLDTSAVPQDLVWRLPKVRHMGAPVLCSLSEASGNILSLSSLEACRSLPSTLQTLELCWQLTLRVTGWLGPSVDQTFVHLLKTSDCPLLRSIWVRISSDVEASVMCAERIRLLFTADVTRMFSASSQLEEVFFKRSNGEEVAKWERKTLGAEM